MRSASSLPPELYRSRPREVRLTGAGRALTALAIVLFVSAPVVAVLLQKKTAADRLERDALLQSQAVTTGVVTRLKRDSDSTKRAWVDYQFVADGFAYSRRVKIPMEQWRELYVGGALPVRYLRDNPATNIPDGVAPSVLPEALAYVIAPVLLLCGLVCWLELRSQQRLLSDGRPVVAIVKNVTKRRTQHGPRYRMRYEFPLMTGVTQPGSAPTSAKGPGAGTSIVVLYDDERPRRSRPYPLSLVRVVDGH